MTKPTKEQIDSATGERLSEWVAVWCMGWNHINESPLQNFYEFVGPSKTRNPEFFNDYFRVNYKDWQPHLPTEKGKAQCWELLSKYLVTLSLQLSDSNKTEILTAFIFKSTGVHLEANLQRDLLKSCLYAEMER